MALKTSLLLFPEPSCLLLLTVHHLMGLAIPYGTQGLHPITALFLRGVGFVYLLRAERFEFLKPSLFSAGVEENIRLTVSAPCL